MSVTTVTSPLQVAWAQVRSVQYPWAVLLLLLVMLPWFLLVAGGGGPLYALGTFFFLHVLLSNLLSGDRRIYRSLGLNRRGALRQQLVISLPLLVVSALTILPGLGTTGWLPGMAVAVTALAVAALALDAAITLHAVGNERGGRRFTATATWFGPAGEDDMCRRLLGVPMLRWTIPAGLALGCVLAVGEDGQGSFLWSLLVAFCLLGAVLGPAFEAVNGTSSLATWQALGLPRRQWSLTVTPIALLAPVLALLTALAVFWLSALWGIVEWDQFRQLLLAAPGLGLLWAGAGLLVVSLAGGSGVHGGMAVGAASPMLFTFSMNVIRDSSSGFAFEAVLGVALLALGLYLQHRLIHGANGARATLDTRRYAR